MERSGCSPSSTTGTPKAWGGTSFFRAFKEQVVHGRIYQTIDDVRAAVRSATPLVSGSPTAQRCQDWRSLRRAQAVGMAIKTEFGTFAAGVARGVARIAGEKASMK